MKKENECELVQDLLLNYVDGLLNVSSKDLVENHLKICPNCKEKFEDLKYDEEKVRYQEKEIDYLKKLKLKSRIKSIIGSLIIILLIFIGYYFNKFITLNTISEKASKYFESENFYIEIISNVPLEENSVLFNKTWYKDGNYKTISYIENETDGITQSFGTEYGETGKTKYYQINENQKTATLISFPFERQKNHLMSFPNPIFISQQNNYMLPRLGAPFYVKISTDNKDIGREYYVLQLDNSKLWVDIDTGLPIMSFGYTSSAKYFKDTKIPLQKSEGIYQYNYSFDCVTDEDVLLPDLSAYEVIENNSLIEALNK